MVNSEPDDAMIRITVIDLTQPTEDIGFTSRLARRMNGCSRVGILRKLLGCVPKISIVWSPYRRKKRKLILDPRLRHILDRLNISVILEVEEVVSSITSFISMKNNTQSLSGSICSDTGSSSNSADSEQEYSLDHNEDNDADQKEEHLQKITVATQKEKEDGLLGGSPTCMTTDDKNSMKVPSKGIQPMPQKKIENRECPICWEPYKVGQEICWSSNKRCTHTFHADCMITWLMKKDNRNDCPMCRSNYLQGA